MIGLERNESARQCSFYRVQVFEDVVGEVVLADGLPQVLGGVELGAIRRQEHQPHVLGHGEIAGEVPACPVHHHEDELGGVARGDLGQEQRHRLGVDPGQNEAVHHAVVRADGAEGVDVLALQSGTDHRANRARCPAPPRRAQQAESALVLEHQPHLPALLRLARDLLVYRSPEFF